MKNDKLLLLIVTIIFIGLISAIWLNRKNAEREKAEIEKKEEHKKFVMDSLKYENEKLEILKNEERSRDEQKRIETEKQNLIESARIANEKRIDGYTNKISSKLDVAILITDDSGQSTNEISSKIASIYRDQGFSVSNSFFSTSFIQSEYLSELQNSSSQVIDMLKLNARTKYVVIGKISYSFRIGTLSVGTTICNAKISIDIISVNQRSIKNGFSFSVNGNGVSESQAKDKAQQLLISKYKSEYSSI